MEHIGWNPSKFGLYQVNVCIFKNTPLVKKFCDSVWSLLHLFDANHAERLDQTVVSFLLNTKYESMLKLYKLTDSIYLNNMPLVLHGVHPAK